MLKKNSKRFCRICRKETTSSKADYEYPFDYHKQKDQENS